MDGPTGVKVYDVLGPINKWKKNEKNERLYEEKQINITVD